MRVSDLKCGVSVVKAVAERFDTIEDAAKGNHTVHTLLNPYGLTGTSGAEELRRALVHAGYLMPAENFYDTIRRTPFVVDYSST